MDTKHLFQHYKQHWLHARFVWARLYGKSGAFLTVGNTKIGSDFALLGLLSKGVVWRQF
jgi:hypothetical protein